MGLLEGEVALKKEWRLAVSQQLLYWGQSLGNASSNSHRFELRSRNLSNKFSEEVKIDL
jgi:hypothetical protein